MRRLSPFNLAALIAGIAFLYLPIVILVIFSCIASGRCLGRLVDALVLSARR
jgi:ABC-type spermidine/putrescine transport system permease subunit II